MSVTMAAGARADTIDTHGYWTSVVDTVDQEQVCGVRTRMDNGAELRLLVSDGDVYLVAHDPRWHVPPRSQVRVTVSVDGSGYDGRATAIDGQTLVVQRLSDAFLDHFVDGNTMVADFGGVRWNVDLTGSSDATSDMIACVKAAAQPGYQS
jgi:hypothetical protein